MTAVGGLAFAISYIATIVCDCNIDYSIDPLISSERTIAINKGLHKVWKRIRNTFLPIFIIGMLLTVFVPSKKKHILYMV